MGMISYVIVDGVFAMLRLNQENMGVSQNLGPSKKAVESVELELVLRRSLSLYGP